MMYLLLAGLLYVLTLFFAVISEKSFLFTWFVNPFLSFMKKFEDAVEKILKPLNKFTK